MSAMALLLTGISPVTLGFAILMAQEILADEDEDTGKDLLRLLVEIGAWVLICLALLGAVTAMAGVIAGGIGAVILLMAYWRRHAARQYALLSTLAVAAERMMPLVPAVEAFAAERRFIFARRTRRLAELLRAGVPLPTALELCRGSLPPRGLVPSHALAMIRVGHENGALARALREAVARWQTHEGLRSLTAGRVLYLCLLTGIGMTVATFLMLKIMPAFQQTFDDFGVELPAITQMLVSASRALVAGPLALVGFVMFVLMMLLVFYTVAWYIGWVNWTPLGLRWLARRAETAAILETLALAVDRDHPLEGPLDSLARSYPQGWVRRRLRRVALGVKAGESWALSLARSGLLGDADLAVLLSAQRLGNLPWAMREMADSNRRRLVYRAQILLQFLFPMVILIYAALVLWFVTAYFLPLVKLIQALT